MYFFMYKGISITYNFYGRHEYTIQYMGDDYFFRTKQEAKNFINNKICVDK